jgi:hypothetical protein
MQEPFEEDRARREGRPQFSSGGENALAQCGERPRRLVLSREMGLPGLRIIYHLFPLIGGRRLRGHHALHDRTSGQLGDSLAATLPGLVASLNQRLGPLVVTQVGNADLEVAGSKTADIANVA